MAPPPRKRGGGAIALLAQGDPPHYGPCWRHISHGPGRQIVIKTGTPSADSRAKPEPKRSRQYSFTDRQVADCHRSPFSPPLPAIGGRGQPLSTYSPPSMRRLVLCPFRGCWRAVRPVRGVARESIALVGVVALEDGDLTRAEPHLRADAAARRAVGDSVLVVISAGCLGPVMLAKGNLAEARALGGRGA